MTRPSRVAAAPSPVVLVENLRKDLASRAVLTGIIPGIPFGQVLALLGPDDRKDVSLWATAEIPTPFARSPLMARNWNKGLKEAT